MLVERLHILFSGLTVFKKHLWLCSSLNGFVKALTTGVTTTDAAIANTPKWRMDFASQSLRRCEIRMHPPTTTNRTASAQGPAFVKFLNIAPRVRTDKELGHNAPGEGHQ
jgi:hypothetical protein